MVPLCDDNITRSDLLDGSGFVDAYTIDKNRPYYEDKVFLLYDNTITTEQSLHTFCKLSKLDTLHHRRFVNIHGKPHTIFCFNNPLYKKDFDSLKLRGKVESTKAKLEIYNFWRNVPLSDLVFKLFYDDYGIGKPIFNEVPEEDCPPNGLLYR